MKRMKDRVTPLALILCYLAIASACSHTANEYKIALVPARGGQRGLYIVNSDSTGARLISTEGTIQLRPDSWSPDGKRIAYFCYGPGDSAIMNNYRIPLHNLLYVMDATGAAQKRLLDFPVSSFRWSADSKALLLVSAYEDPQREDSEIVGGARPPLSAVYIFDLGSDRPRRVTELGYHCSGAWAPDGTRIAFSFGSERNTASIYVASLDGKHTRRISNSETIDMRPRWSPDRKTLAYVAVSAPGTEMTGAGVWIADAEGNNRKQLTTLPISEVSWSPDGKMLLLDSANAFYVVPSTGGNPVKLSGSLERPLDPVFTPDGRKVMFRSNHEGDWHLYTVDLNGANLGRIIGQLSASQFCLSPLQ